MRLKKRYIMDGSSLDRSSKPSPTRIPSPVHPAGLHNRRYSQKFLISCPFIVLGLLIDNRALLSTATGGLCPALNSAAITYSNLILTG